jgi:hypothetical protein
MTVVLPLLLLQLTTVDLAHESTSSLSTQRVTVQPQKQRPNDMKTLKYATHTAIWLTSGYKKAAVVYHMFLSYYTAYLQATIRTISISFNHSDFQPAISATIGFFWEVGYAKNGAIPLTKGYLSDYLLLERIRKEHDEGFSSLGEHWIFIYHEEGGPGKHNARKRDGGRVGLKDDKFITKGCKCGYSK